MRSLDAGLVTSPSRARGPEPLIDLFRSDASVEAISEELETHSAYDIITAAVQVYGQEAIVSTAFGAGGLCVMDMAQRADPNVRAYYIDTGFAFPETEALLRRWVDEQKLNLLRVLPALTPEEQGAQYGEELWRSDPDQCCAIRKVEPNERALAGSKLWIAALRRDESPSRKKTPILQEVRVGSLKLLKLSPIATWTKKEVWSYIMEHELPYNELHDRGYPSIGCTHCTRPVREGGDEREGRWAGTDKKECGLHVIRRTECC